MSFLELSHPQLCDIDTGKVYLHHKVFNSYSKGLRQKNHSHPGSRSRGNRQRSTRNNEALCKEGTREPCVGSNTRRTPQFFILLHRYGVVRFESSRLYTSYRSSESIRMPTLFCQRPLIAPRSSTNLEYHETNCSGNKVYPWP